MLLKFQDFADKLELPSSSSSACNKSFTPNEEAIAMILGMGFSRGQAIKALKATVTDY